jgi:hypothetical protein
MQGGGNSECSVFADCFHAECGDGYCIDVQGTGADTCIEDLECRHTECNHQTLTCDTVFAVGSDQCTTYIPDCGECESDEDCEDYDYCEGTRRMHFGEVCVEGSCVEEPPTEIEDCSDNNFNTCKNVYTKKYHTETCQEVGDTTECEPHNNLIDCRDPYWCNGQEYCVNGGGNPYCADGTDIDCSDNDLSKIDTCNNVPDGKSYTLDYANPFTSECMEDGQNSGHCTTGSQTLTHTCNVERCDAECDSDDDCASECPETGCVGVDWYDYSGGSGLCNDDCQCETENCKSSVSVCDSRCMGNCEVTVKLGHDMNPDWDNIYTVKNDIYMIATSNGQCGGMTIPVQYWHCECPNTYWGADLQPAIEATTSDWEPKYDRLCTTDAGNYAGNPTYTMVCGPESICDKKIHEFTFPADESKKFWTGVGPGKGTFQIDLLEYNDCYGTAHTVETPRALACVDSIEDKNNIPYGQLNNADCSYADGWAKDSARENEPIFVHLYFDPGANQLVRQTKADINGHDFHYTYPQDVLDKICDGNTHIVTAYGLDYQDPVNGPNQYLPSSRTIGPCAC